MFFNENNTQQQQQQPTTTSGNKGHRMSILILSNQKLEKKWIFFTRVFLFPRFLSRKVNFETIQKDRQKKLANPISTSIKSHPSQQRIDPSTLRGHNVKDPPGGGCNQRLFNRENCFQSTHSGEIFFLKQKNKMAKISNWIHWRPR